MLTKTQHKRSIRRGSAPVRRASEPRPRHTPSVSQFRARRGSGIEDRALYSCECGFTWTGEVTASPSCAHCGTPQAW